MVSEVINVDASTSAEITADDENWNDEDPFSSGSLAPSPPRLIRDSAVARVAADLQDDYKRSGALTMVDVTTLAQRRGLSSDDIEDVLLSLAEADVELSEERIEAGYDGSGDLDGGRVRRQIASIERDQLGAYLAAASRIPLLTAEQEVRLGRAIRAGQEALQALDADVAASTLPRSRSRRAAIIEAGRQAHRDLVSANLRLVVSIAKLPRYAHCGVELPDRIQDGNAGLMRAADKYDAELGYKFSTYATWWIRQHIDRGVGDRGRAIRLPIHVHEQVKKVRAAKARLEGQLERPVTLGELSSDLGMEAGRVAAVLTWSEPVLSYDTLIGDKETTSLLDLISGDTADVSCVDPATVILSRQLESDVARVLAAVLTPREVEVLKRRYGLDGRDVSTLDDIGDDFGITRERIRQIQVKAMEVLQADPRVDSLYEYLVDHTLRDAVASPLEPRETPPPKRRSTPDHRRKAAEGLHV